MNATSGSVSEMGDEKRQDRISKIQSLQEQLSNVPLHRQKAYNEYKVYNEMFSTLSKVLKKVRKDKETSKSLDKLEEQLKNREFHAGLEVWTLKLKYGRINQTTDLLINASQEIQSINNKITYRETESSFTELVSDQY